MSAASTCRRASARMLFCRPMFRRQTTGSVVCVSCGYLVGVKDDRCYHCGRRNPGLLGFAPALRSLGHDLGFVPFVTGFCIVMYVLSHSCRWRPRRGGGLLSFLSPEPVSTGHLRRARVAFPCSSSAAGGRSSARPGCTAACCTSSSTCMWIRQLAPGVGELYGPGRMVIIYTLARRRRFHGQLARRAYFSAGCPGPLGAGASSRSARQRRSSACSARSCTTAVAPARGMVHAQALSWAVMVFMFGLHHARASTTTRMPADSPAAILLGRLLDPLKPERINHMLVRGRAARRCRCCSIVVSVVHGTSICIRVSLG